MARKQVFDDPGAVTLVEWPERTAGLLPPDTLLVTIRHLSPNSREITVAAANAGTRPCDSSK